MPLIFIQSLTFSLPVGFSDLKRRRCPGTVSQPSRKRSSARLLSSSCLWRSSLVSAKRQRLSAHLSHSSVFECRAVTVSHLSHSLPDITCPQPTPATFTQGAQIWFLVYRISSLDISSHVNSKRQPTWNHTWYKPRLYVLILDMYFSFAGWTSCTGAESRVYSLQGFTALINSLYNIQWSWGEKPAWLWIRSSDLWMMHCAETRGLFARRLCCPLRDSDFKRPKYEANLSYITDDVFKCVRRCISKPRSCGFAPWCLLLARLLIYSLTSFMVVKIILYHTVTVSPSLLCISSSLKLFDVYI